MDEMACAYQREHAKAYKTAEAARIAWHWADVVNAQHAQAHAFRQQWIWRFGNLMDLEVC
jgi:hypothetical protein